MKKTSIGIISIMAMIFVIALISFGCQPSKPEKVPSQAPSPTGPNPQTNTTLTNLSNPPSNSSSDVAVGFRIQQAIVENNVDPATNKAVSDHLEVTLSNLIDKDISDLNVNYSITDLKNSKKESYSVKLEGFVLKAKDTQTIHFDNGTETNHFWVNPYSMYYLSTDPLEFSITISAAGYQSQSTEVKKDAGGAEQAD